ncbi:MAG: SPFH domain-containing protein, partial [Planctomycetota bacterium]
LAAGLALDAGRIRRRLGEAREWQPRESHGWDEDDEEGDANVTLHDVHHSRTLHFAVMALPATLLVGFLAVVLLWTQSGGETGLLAADDMAATSVICLVACCLWLVLSRSFEAAGRDELPEGPALMLAFRDLQWTTLLVAAGILGTKVWPEEGFGGNGQPWSPPEIWVARAILVWLVAVSIEQIVRIALAWLRRGAIEEGFTSPSYLLLREAVFVRGNPIASVFETIEARFGVSFRSSWAIRFVRAAALPSLVAVLLLFWGLTCLSVVGTNELGIRESFGRIRGDLFPASIQSKLPFHFGRINDAPLQPGLHLKLPWPFGRVRHYPVKEVFTKPIGYVPGAGRQRAYLWSKTHAEEEFALVLGTGAEVVAVNALVFYKISEDKEGFLDYVYHSIYSENPEDRSESPDLALDAYAHRALMEQTRSTTLGEILSTNRAEFAGRLKESLREYADENRLGIDVIDVALVALHPPIEAAEDYLDVISAQINANRFQIDAEGESLVTVQTALTESNFNVAKADVFAAEQLGRASEESAEFLAIREAYSAAPDAFKLRLYFEAVEEALAGKRLIVVDKTLAGNTYFDTRADAENKETIPSGVQ